MSQPSSQDRREDSSRNTDNSRLHENHIGTENVGRSNSDSKLSLPPSKLPASTEEENEAHSVNSTHSCPESFGIEGIMVEAVETSNINRKLKTADVLFNSFMEKIPLRKMALVTQSNPPIKNNNNKSGLPELQVLQCDGPEGLVS